MFFVLEKKKSKINFKKTEWNQDLLLLSRCLRCQSPPIQTVVGALRKHYVTGIMKRLHFSLFKGVQQSQTVFTRYTKPLGSVTASHNSSHHCYDTWLTFWFPALTHRVELHISHFLAEISNWIPAKHLPIDLDKTEPLFSSQKSCP